MSSLVLKVFAQRITNCFRTLVKIYGFIRKLIFIEYLCELKNLSEIEGGKTSSYLLEIMVYEQ